MTAKEQKIKEAYGEYWEIAKDFVNESGWCYQRKNIGFDKLSKEIMIEFNGYYFRPIILQGIENNAGWIKIESEDDLPKEDVDCFLCSHDGYIYCDRYLVNTKNFLSSHYKYITHYQPIQKPEPPIY